MAYNKEEIYKQSLEAIKENNLYFVEDVISCLPLVRSTFYDFFPSASNESTAIQ